MTLLFSKKNKIIAFSSLSSSTAVRYYWKDNVNFRTGLSKQVSGGKALTHFQLQTGKVWFNFVRKGRPSCYKTTHRWSFEL